MSENIGSSTSLKANTILQASLPFAQSLFVPFGKVVTDLSPLVVAGSDTLKTRIPGPMTVVDKRGAASEKNLTDVTVTLDQYKEVKFVLTDELNMNTILELEKVFLPSAFEALYAHLIGAVVTLVSNNSNFVKLPAAYGADSDGVIAPSSFTRSNIILARAAFSALKAPQFGRYIIGNPSYRAAWKTSFTGAVTTAAETNAENFDGFELIESDAINPSNTNDVTGLFIGQQSAVCFAARPIIDPEAFPGLLASGVIPGTNIPVQLRKYYDNSSQANVLSLQINYGMSKGNSFGYRVIPGHTGS